jgi:hypothetical protein
MSKPNEKEIKAWLRSLPGSMSAWSKRDEIMTQAIRRLIEKISEWQEKAEELWEASPTLERFQDNVPLKKFIKEIRDFGKEEK